LARGHGRPKGVFALAERYGLEVVAFDEMEAQG
jgi:hypothetical protein